MGHSRGSRDVLSSNLSAYLTDEYRDLLEEIHQVLENGFPCDLQSLDNYKKPLFKLVSKAFKQKWTYLCVRDLVTRNKTSFTCSLLGQKDVREYPEPVAAAGPRLPDNTIVLVGLIGSHPDSSSRKTPHGGLYFCDNTGEIPCALVSGLCPELNGNSISTLDTQSTALVLIPISHRHGLYPDLLTCISTSCQLRVLFCRSSLYGCIV